MKFDKSFQISNGQIDRMFDHHQYFPVLRWKGAERVALRRLDPSVKAHITPIVEFVPRDFENKPLSVVLASKAKQIAENWGWMDLLFVDFSLLGNEKAKQSVPSFTRKSDEYRLQAGLVTGLHQPADFQSAIQAALATNNRELCLRVNAYELQQAGCQQAINNLLARFEREPSAVHLVLDFQAVNDPLPTVGTWLSTIPSVNEWRSFTVVVGAFPKDLTQLEKNRQHTLPRSDWLIWRNYAASATGRIPSFGDYTIQHGIFEEHEGKFFNFSASIRYTSSELWVIMRGEGVQNEDGPGYSQWPAWAQLLCEKDEFCGPQFSYGDTYIHTMSQQVTGTGAAKDWLAATFNHHLTFVARQIQELFANSSSSVSSLV